MDSISYRFHADTNTIQWKPYKSVDTQCLKRVLMAKVAAAARYAIDNIIKRLQFGITLNGHKKSMPVHLNQSNSKVGVHWDCTVFFIRKFRCQTSATPTCVICSTELSLWVQDALYPNIFTSAHLQAKHIRQDAIREESTPLRPMLERERMHRPMPVQCTRESGEHTDPALPLHAINAASSFPVHCVCLPSLMCMALLFAQPMTIVSKI